MNVVYLQWSDHPLFEIHIKWVRFAKTVTVDKTQFQHILISHTPRAVRVILQLHSFSRSEQYQLMTFFSINRFSLSMSTF